MPELLLPAFAILLGFAGLVWSADRFVEGAAAIARAAGMTPLVIGLTIVSFGTSAPEVLVSINAALSGAGELAIGNALGSNLANIGLVLGVTALVTTLPIHRSILTQEWPVLLGVTALAGWMLADAEISRVEGWALILLIIPVMTFFVVIKKKSANTSELQEGPDIPNMSAKLALVWFVIGLGFLIASSKVLVWGATETALIFNVSPLIIGLTVVAVGTSLPELAASVISALKGHHDIALGNVIGSNLFNILAVMSVPALIHPLQMEPSVFTRDYVSMAGLTVLLLALTLTAMIFHYRKRVAGLGKLTGLVLLGSYALYYVVLFSAER